MSVPHVVVDLRRASEPIMGLGRYASALESHLSSSTLHLEKYLGRSSEPATRFPRFTRLQEDLIQIPQRSRKADLWHTLYPEGVQLCPTVATIPDLCALRPNGRPTLGQRYYRRTTLNAIHGARALICISDFARRELIETLSPRQPVFVTYMGIDEDLLNHYRWSPDVERPYILYFGGHSPRKNVSQLLRCWPKIYSSSGVRLVVVGKLRVNCRPEGVDALPNLAAHDLYRLLSRASASVYCSSYEGFGMPIVESLALGIPVVCQQVGITHSLREDSVLLYDGEDAEFRDRVFAAIKGWRPAPEASRIAREQFTWKRCADATLEIYGGCL